MADDEATLYVDGIEAATTSAPLTLATLRVSTSACLLAVHVRDVHLPHHGFLASASNGLLSSSSWRCTSYEDADWFLPTYNDFHWLRAEALSMNDESSAYGPITGINTQAQWIWSAETTNPLDAFCRLDLCQSCDTIQDMQTRTGS